MLNSLDMLKNSKASNPDGVPTNLVKDAVNFIDIQCFFGPTRNLSKHLETLENYANCQISSSK